MPFRPTALRLLAPLVALLLGACARDAGPLRTREDAFAWHGAATPGMVLRIRDMNGDVERTIEAVLDRREAPNVGLLSWRVR